MALVRRIDVIGPGGAPPVASHGNGQAAVATVPPQGPPAGADAAAPSITSAVPGWAGGFEAAASASKGASFATVAFGFLLVAVGAFAAYALNRWGNNAEPFKIGNQTSAYAGIVVFSAAVERFLEPFAHWLPGSRTKNEYEAAVAALANGHPTVSVREVAAAKARVDRTQANRTVLMWSLATAVATAAAGASGFYLLHMIAAEGWTAQIPDWVDALVTGLVVGTGTKPLHDLITRAQAGKGNA